MVVKKQSPPLVIDGDTLKLAREIQGLTLKELAAKVCLSHQHIAQLEGDSLAIFFTLDHKIQVAKKVGAALGLAENDFLTPRDATVSSDKSTRTENSFASSVTLPENADLFARAGKKSPSVKPRLFLIPTLAIGCIAGSLASQIYSAEVETSNLAQILTLKMAISELLHPANPVIETVNVSDAAEHLASEPTGNSIDTNQETCTYRESDLTHYQTTSPSKKGEMVYVLSKGHQKVCIIDGQNKVVSLDLAEGGSQSVYGQAPFTVVSSDLSKFDLYFQGWKVRPDTPNSKVIRLDAANLAGN